MARKVTITLPDDLLESIRERADERGVSAYVTEAVRHRDAMDKLRELGEFLDTEYGPAPPEDIDAARAELIEALWGDSVLPRKPKTA
ncbi:hypothetical protein [Nocardia mangyaensis]|uniref:hypothetical protein n=1 Tax=Nocardia mangyaensis TaxID=2213200 RepID=UPI002675A7BA|nr:hypothetical protein [Nocardia mangyaensis]MDO3650192.1 hypothetical protein [Nocardia mangyaensis]